MVEGSLKRLRRAQAVGAGRGHMVGIAACAVAEQLHFAAEIGIAGHDECGGGFADVDAVAAGGKGVGDAV